MRDEDNQELLNQDEVPSQSDEADENITDEIQQESEADNIVLLAKEAYSETENQPAEEPPDENAPPLTEDISEETEDQIIEDTPDDYEDILYGKAAMEKRQPPPEPPPEQPDKPLTADDITKAEIKEIYNQNPQLTLFMNMLRGSGASFAMNRIMMQKIIDSSWVEAIEKGLLHVDNVLRNPRRTIEDVEEIVPIALSRKITVESVKHLAQHTDLIQSVDKRTGKITPSKILNVHKEESFMTYENKFVNTLIDRLYIFITMRYEKLAEVAKDEEVVTLGFSTEIDDNKGGKMKIDVHIENEHNLETRDRSGYTVWQRVEKLKKAVEGYKGSELCKTLGSTFIRPPVMRTNAIMKNVDLKACLTLWQYIESYDKVGYEINIENSAVMPEDKFIDDFYELVGLHLMLFRDSVLPEEQEVLEVKQMEPVSPKIIKIFEDVGARFDSTVEGGAGYITQTTEKLLNTPIPQNLQEIIREIDRAIAIEHNYQEMLRAKELEEQRAAEELERQRMEEERIEAERQAELARIKAEKEEEERRIQELLEQKRIEQEEAERERAKQEAERLRLLEEKRKREEAERQRLEEQRMQQLIDEAAERERQRVEDEKQRVRSELGVAEGKEIKKEEPPAAAAETEKREETPAEIAARMKREQQQREKERAEAERAQRLKAERQYFESKPFKVIYREYCKNPFWMLVRLIRYILVMVFGIIPKNNDRPDFKEQQIKVLNKRETKLQEKNKRTAMEIYYKKYAQTFKYRKLREIQDRKFQRKRKKEMKNKPRPVYKSKLTPEQQLEVQKQMRALYKEYHVSVFEHIRRWFKGEIQKYRNWREQLDESDIKFFTKVTGAILALITAAALGFSIYVTVCTITGEPANIFGYSVLRVETGSMEPTLHVDDFIIVQRCDPKTLKTGDIISFYSEQEDIKGMLVTHRITGKNHDGTFITRGDANPIEDSTFVKRDNILGVYVRKSQFYMWIGSFADKNKLFLMLVLIPLSLISIFEMRSVIKIGRKAHEETQEEAEIRAKKDYERRMREAIEAEKKRLAEEHYDPEKEKAQPPPDEENTEDSDEEPAEDSAEADQASDNDDDKPEQLSKEQQNDNDEGDEQ